MDADRSGDTVTESAVDRELQAMLAADPSPEFVARVRTRIADEPRRSASWLSWKFAAVAAMAAVAVLAVVVARSREAVRPQPVERRAASTDGARPTPSAAATAQEPHVASAFGRTSTATSPAKAGHRVPGEDQAGHNGRVLNPQVVMSAEPEILIDARESSALHALILGARDGRVDLEPALRASTPTAMDLPPIGVIDIPFLTIDPITPGTGEEGVRQ